MIGIEKCACGHKSCKDYWLTGVGKFVQGSGFTEDEAREIAAILNASRRPDAPRAGEGWVLVPVEPDGGMKMAGCAAPRSEATRNATNTLERQMETTADIYRAMVAMAPAPPQADGGEG